MLKPLVMKIFYSSLAAFLLLNISTAFAQEIAFVPPPPPPPDECTMGGTYRVGAGSNFVTVTEALDSLKRRGISSNIVLELAASYNSSAETFPIRFPKDTEIPCFSGTFSLVLRPADGVSNAVIEGGNTNSILLLDGCSYVTIDGRAAGIGNSSSLSIVNDSAGNAISFINASRNSVMYVSLSAAGTESGNVVLFYGFENGGGCHYNSIKHCKIFSPLAASAVKPVLLHSKSDSTAGYNSSDTITGCEFYNFSQSAIDLGEYGASGWFISGNSFYKAAPYDFRETVYVIRINSFNNALLHTIENNFFGGTAANCTGGVMDIGYKDGFTAIWLWGEAIIRNNKFARMYFHNTINAATNGITMLYADGISSTQTNTISNNQFGGVNPADSIHVTNDNTAMINEMDVHCIYARQSTNGRYYITGNYFSGIRCYATAAHLSLTAIAATNGSPVIASNQIGGPSALNSIINAAPGFSYGIFCVGASVKINSNTICRVKNTSICCNSAMQGISVSGGGIDSICNNDIFHLENSISNINNSGPLVGILVAPQTTGGFASLIEGNNIYSLYSNSTSAGGIVSGIVSNANVNIRRNFIHNLYSYSTVNAAVNGILVPNKESTIENNMISLGYDSSGNSITAGNLIFNGIVGGNVLRHNSVFIGGSGVGGGAGPGGSSCYVFVSNTLNLHTEYHNNIFANTRQMANSSAGDRHQCISISHGSIGDNNLFYFNSVGNSLGTQGSTQYATLAMWQTSTGLDAASFFADPQFVLPAAASNSVNLHLQIGTPAEAAGSNDNTLANDFDNEERSLLTPVDIGADAADFRACPVNQWTGSVDNNWGTPGNWSCNILPDKNTDVVINNGTVLVNINGTCRSLYTAPSVNFTVATGFTLTVVH